MFDNFGEHDPRKMPTYLFSSALHLDYSSAVKADITRQNFTVCPRHWYIDAAFRCPRCGNTFIFSAAEQRFWYEELGFYVDSHVKHCQACRRELRELKAFRQEYDRDIAVALSGHGGLENKQRLLAVIDAMDDGGVTLPEKIHEHRRTLKKQIERLQTLNPPPSGAAGTS